MGELLLFRPAGKVHFFWALPALIVLGDFSHRQPHPHYVSKEDEPTLLAEAAL
jgi:hypothetical protein